MGVADDLLTLANSLGHPAPAEPEQIWLRRIPSVADRMLVANRIGGRSVSTAYYALFHLLVGEAVQSWNGSSGARVGLERAFQHANMKAVSRAVEQGSWRGWSTPPPPLPAELRAVAAAFVTLQDARQQADYDNAKAWTPTDAERQIELAQSAFQSWRKIRTDPASNEYLLSLLVGKKRE